MAAAGEVMPHSAAKEVVGVGGCNGSSSSSASSLGSGADQELHVLAVDDSYVDLKVIERLLRISSCKVTAVESAKRALQYLGLDGETNSVGFSDLKVNLIMTDYSMPGMTGYELLKKIKGSTAFRETPVVIMSSENVLTRVDRCLEEGAEEFIMKPVKLSDVKRLKEFIIREGTEERGITTLGKRKLQDGILSSSLVELSPTESPACEVALSALPSSTPTSYISTSMTPAYTVSTTSTSAMSSSKRTTLQSGE